MESKTLLDYALFQLTPTRTRCDLVIFAGKNKEKIATGLLEPYVSHLKSAKDQISKGGYSITLKPPPSSKHSSWFTKATLQRFVRFVSTPEVLERFVTIEREMDQIESSSNGGTVESPAANASSTDDGDPKSKVHQSTDMEAEETPKIRLQRVMESRKAVLKKEQAMAYARALVAGFEMDCLCDLVSFSDAFGAQRLREACVNFMELCNKKHEDKIWMDEVAAMQASYLGTPGIILAAENHDTSQVVLPKGSASDSFTGHGSMDTGKDNGFATELNPQQTEGTAQLPTWQHHPPHYMQHSQQPPMFQPYPSYMFPGMQVGPSHYPGNMPWPANFHNPGTPHDTNIRDSQRKHKSHKKKEKHEDTENVESSDADHSSSRSNSSDEKINNKKHNKKSSKKVVIRNINYITSSRNEKGSSDSESYSSEESLKRYHKPSKKAIDMSKNALDAENEETIVIPEEEKKEGNWDIFQNLLMREPDSNTADMGSKSMHIQEEYTDNKSYTGSKLASDDFLFTERPNGNGFSEEKYYPQKDHFSTEHSIVKTRAEEDWVVGTKSEISLNPVGINTNIDDHNIFSGDQTSGSINISILENRKDGFSDDSFMVQSRVSDAPQLTQPKHDDIFMVMDINGSNQSKNNNMPGNSDSYEPEDLKMMLGQDHVTEQAVTSWSHDMETTLTSRFKSEPSNHSVVDDAKQLLGNGKASKTGTNKDSGRKVGGKESKSKAPTSGTIGRSKSDIPPRSKISTAGSKMSRSKSETEEDKRKKMEELSKQRQKRIAERSATRGTIAPETSIRATKEVKKTTSIKSSKDKPRASPDQENKKSNKPFMMRSSTIDRLATSRTTNKSSPPTERKVVQNRKPPPSVVKKTIKGTQEQQKVKVNPSDKKNGGKNNNNNKPKMISSEKSEKTRAKNSIVEDSESTVKVLHTVSSFEKREVDSTISDNVIHDDDRAVELTTPPPQITVNPTDVNDTKVDEKPCSEKKRLTFSPEISVLEIPSYTPATPDNETSLEHSRKKWNNGESSPKIPKGFRRLLLFGRRT